MIDDLVEMENSKGFRKGFFRPKNPYKYIGKNLDKIIYRSSWEKKFFEFLDNNIKILGWCSEPFAIPYMKPDPNTKNGYKNALYYPDLYVEFVDKDGEFKKEVIEIKPSRQTKKSKSRKPLTKIYENYVYTINMAKFEAAEKWCKINGFDFKIVTEKTLFHRKKT